MLLAAYLNGRAKTNGSEVREELLDKLALTRPMTAFGCTWRGDATHRGVQRLVRLVRTGKAPAEALGLLTFGAWTQSLTLEDVEPLVGLLLGIPKPATEPAMSMLVRALEREPGAAGEIEPLAWKALENTSPNASVMAERYWGQLSSRYASRDPKRMVATIARQYVGPRFISKEPERQAALRAATLVEATSAWDIVGNAILAAGHDAHNLLELLRAWYGELIPTDHLLSWAGNHESSGPGIVAHVVAPNPVPGSRADALIRRFPW